VDGFATWVGTESQHTGVPLSKLLEAGINASIPALFVAGAGVLVLGLVPRFVSAATYGIIGYSFVVNLVGSLVKGQDWIKNSSLFTHMKLAPAVKPDWGEASVVMLVGLAAAMIGAAVFVRRDIEYA
jgi:polyether ionophore transport system permease protein